MGPVRLDLGTGSSYTLNRAATGEITETISTWKREAEEALRGAFRPGWNALPVKLADKLWNLHQGWQWRAFAGSGRSDGDADAVSPLGSRDAVYGL